MKAFYLRKLIRFHVVAIRNDVVFVAVFIIVVGILHVRKLGGYLEEKLVAKRPFRLEKVYFAIRRQAQS